MTDIEELIAAARALLPYLETSTDQKEDRSDWTHDQVMADLNAQLEDQKRSRGDRLRDEAEKADAEEAAIWRFRKALEGLEP